MIDILGVGLGRHEFVSVNKSDDAIASLAKR